jgi:hypothetical protein
MALLALFVTLGVGFNSTSSTVAAEADLVAAGEKCNCQYQSGSYGVIRDNDCVVVNCWRPIEDVE